MAFRKRSTPVVLFTLSSFLGTQVLPVVALAAGAATSESPLVRDDAADPAVFGQVAQATSGSSSEPSLDMNGQSAAPVAKLKAPSVGVPATDLGANPGPARVDPSSLATVAANAISDPQRVTELITGGDKSGVSSRAISVPAGAGKIDGMGESFSAQLSTGVVSYSIPLSLPAARGGAQPSLALSYSSGGGLGVAGMGWELGTVSISRQTDRGIPKYDDRAAWHAEQDRFVFNGGQELVPVCTVGAAPGVACSGALS